MTVPLRALIADDEPLSLRRLELGLERIEGVHVVGAAQNGAEARSLIRSTSPDLVLLDIRMPDASGLDLAEELQGKNAPEVIFVTAYNRHAARAFDLDAVDYVLKPLDFDRLAEAVERARARIAAREGAQRLAEMSAVLEQLRDGDEPETEGYAREIWVNDRRGRVRVPVDQVIWFEAEREYVRIHGPERSYLVRRALRELTDRLDPEQFLRLHRSGLVNRAKIERVVRRPSGGLAAVLCNGVEVPVGRKYQNAVRKRLRM